MSKKYLLNNNTAELGNESCKLKKSLSVSDNIDFSILSFPSNTLLHILIISTFNVCNSIYHIRACLIPCSVLVLRLYNWFCFDMKNVKPENTNHMFNIIRIK